MLRVPDIHEAQKHSFLAHLCSCTVGSYASLSVCLSVCDNKKRLEKIISSNVTWVKVKGQVGQTRLKGHDIGRWAHVNVKLHLL